MELTAAASLPVTPAPSTPSQAPTPVAPPLAESQSPVAPAAWPPQQWAPQQWAEQQMPQQPWPPSQQPWAGQPLPPQQWLPAGAVDPTWTAAPAAIAAPPMSVAKRKSGRARVVDMVFGLSMLIAVGGVAFAIGRATAPTSTATNAPFAGLGGFPGRTGQNAVVPPAASSAPDVSVQQQAAPSGAPVIASPGTGTVPGAPQGAAPGGFGRGGLTGTVSALGDGTITFTTADGQTTEVTTTDSTTYHKQAAATAADVTVGSSVRITMAGGFGGGFGGGQPGQGLPAASAAPGGAAGVPTLSATDVEILLPTTDQGTTAPAQGRGGFGRGGLTGTVSAVGDGSISITTADGQTLSVATSDATTYHQQAAATAADVAVGSSIRITAAGGFGGGFGGGLPGQGAPAASAAPGGAAPAAAITASDVEILLPTGQ